MLLLISFSLFNIFYICINRVNIIKKAEYIVISGLGQYMYNLF